MLQVEELQCIMEEALRENGLRLPASDVQDLTFALYEEALGEQGVDNGEINIDQLKDVLAKHDGVLENLTNSLTKWLVPVKTKPKESSLQAFKTWFNRRFSKEHIKSQWQLFAFIGFILIVNVILWISRACYFRNFANLDESRPNPFYMLSRANGRTLLFNSTMILVVVLRYTITKMRDLGLSKVLPLDHNIYVHKLIGSLLFLQAWFHTLMHLINFGVNVQPDPVKFVQINTEFWPEGITSAEQLEDGQSHHANWLNLGYHLPPGCELKMHADAAENCPEDSINLEKNITACQVSLE